MISGLSHYHWQTVQKLAGSKRSRRGCFWGRWQGWIRSGWRTGKNLSFNGGIAECDCQTQLQERRFLLRISRGPFLPKETALQQGEGACEPERQDDKHQRCQGLMIAQPCS